MRNLLLGGAAITAAAAAFAGVASAQTTLSPTYSEGVPSTPLPVQGANDSNNYQAASLPGGVANPVPGSVVVRFNGRVLAYGFDQANSFDKTVSATAPAKLNNYGYLGYMRLYSGVDGLAANGLKYGAAIEIRVNEGPTAGSSSNDNSSANSHSSTLYVRRQFVYFGTDTAGIIRAGQADSVNGIFDNGVTTFQNFDNGAWNGDLPGAFPGNAQIAFPFLSQSGADYDYAKVVYLSPQFAGFDVGVQFAPTNSVATSENNVDVASLAAPTSTTLTQCAIAASGCPNLASSGVLGDSARFKNEYAAGVRYQNRIGDLALYGYGAYVGSGHVNYTGLNVIKGVQQFQGFNGLSAGDGGAAITYAGFTVGGHVLYGDINGAMALQPKGGVTGLAWLGGVQYAIGPLTLGASYYDFSSQGSPNLVHLTQRHETGTAAGLTYGIAPGFSLFTSYLYGTRHQGGFDFQTSAASTAKELNSVGAHEYNSIQSQVFAVGTIVKW